MDSIDWIFLCRYSNLPPRRCPVLPSKKKKKKKKRRELGEAEEGCTVIQQRSSAKLQALIEPPLQASSIYFSQKQISDRSETGDVQHAYKLQPHDQRGASVQSFPSKVEARDVGCARARKVHEKRYLKVRDIRRNRDQSFLYPACRA